MARIISLVRLRRKRHATPQPHRRLRHAVVALVAVIAALLVLHLVALYYVDWLWFGEVGLRTVFWKHVIYGLVLGLSFGLGFLAIVYGNVELARRLAPRYRAFEGIDVVEYVHESASRRIRQVTLALSAFVALLIGFAAARAWLLFARAFDSLPFAVKDPVFHHDLSFYIFTLPAWQYVYNFLYAALIVAIVGVSLVHLILGAVQLRASTPTGQSTKSSLIASVRRVQIQPKAVAQLSSLLGALFLLGGVGYLLKAWNLLFSTAGVVFGAGYTDLTVRLPIIRGLMILALALGALLIYNAFRPRRLRWLVASIGLWVVCLIVFLGIVPAVWQALFVTPNQLTRELPYLARNLAATRAAFNLEAITEKPYALSGDLSAQTLAANAETVDNIRLWDPETLQRSYGQLQQLRPYYQFTTVSVDRYLANGVYRQTMLAPRELNVAGLPPQAQTWVNQHITYTHGFGVAVSAVNQVASGGAPDFLVENIPVTAAASSLMVTQPRIYYGLNGINYVLVKTKDAEFDYPGPGGDVYTSYSGSGGIPAGSLLNRLALAVRFGTIKFLTTTAITSQSRAILYDNIMSRVEKAAPFLTFDANPYMVIAGGRLYWIADAYTTTDRYPYSQPLKGVNYMRNSVKVVIEAYNGTMRFYVFDQADPMIRTYERMFPGMFLPRSAMPSALQAHVRYPMDYFTTQAEVFATYHVTDPTLLYNKGNQWQIPTGVSVSGAGQMNPYYMIMRLPGQTREEFVLIVPFVPNARTNMIAWLGAESDAPNYGKAISFGFPSSQSVYGPAQVEAAVNQNPTISAQRTLWDQQGSRVIFGNLIVVPIQDSLLYIQPLYLESVTTQLPQVQRVIAFYRSPSATPNLPTGQQQNVVMEPTLDGALAAIFGSTTPSGVPPSVSARPTAAASHLIAQANAQYAAAQAALRTGNLAGFAREIDALGATLARLRSLH